MKKKFFAGLATGLFMFGMVGMANATIINYEYTATLYPQGVNGSGPVPSTASAIGTFWYDDATPTSWPGSYMLEGLYFEPELITTAVPLYCDPITDCISETPGNFARYNSAINLLEFILNVPSQSYYLAIHTIGMDGYSNNNAYGQWSIDTIKQVGSPVPEPATMFLFGAGLAGLVGYRRRQAKKK